MAHLSAVEIETRLDDVAASPPTSGRVVAIVTRPAVDRREMPSAAHLSPEHGLEGDRWAAAGGPLEQQVSLMNARLLCHLAGGDEAQMALAGDNLIVDLDLGAENLPPGQRLHVGEALLEITAAPHTGCGKFAARFGRDAARLVNAAARRELYLRGRYARILQPGLVRVGDPVHKVPPDEAQP